MPGHALMPDARAGVLQIIDDHMAVVSRSRERLVDDIVEFADDLAVVLDRGGKLVVFGNGGSAADAQHFAAELVGRFSRPRRALPAMALTTNTSAVTAIANDFDYASVFARQVEAFVRGEDLVVGISTSGDADSVVEGIRSARMIGARAWGMTGESGGRLANEVDRCILVPSRVTARIQEIHITIVHAVSELVDARLAAIDRRPRA